MTALSLSQISKRFGPTAALSGVHLSLDKGEVHALIGENGAGKSTLMNVLAGLVKADEGSMEVEGASYAPSSPLDARERGIALIHQELSLFPHLSVAENIMMGIEPSNWGLLDSDKLRARTSEVLRTFHHPEIKPESRVSNLSIAARQIVEISRAIAARARFILMDEPTSSLQRDDVEHLFGLIRQFKTHGITVVYISHFLEEVREIADKFTVLRDGHSVATGRIDSVSDDELITHMVGRRVDNLFPHRPATSTVAKETLLEVKDLAAPPALKSASFELKRGEILGIAGLMGSGRTNVVRTIFGLDKRVSGSIRVKNQTQGVTPAQRLSQRVGYLSEDRKNEGLAITLSIADNVTITRFKSCSRFGWLNLSRQRSGAQDIVSSLAVKARTSCDV